MGAKLTVADINSKSEQDIIDMKQDVIKDMKPEVKERFEERKAEILANRANAGTAAATTTAAEPT